VIIIRIIFHQISIPSGAIKRLRRRPGGLRNLGISIPSGAIKSFSEFPFIVTTVKFQFLLVRLKGKEVELAFQSEDYFNSFWCD